MKFRRSLVQQAGSEKLGRERSSDALALVRAPAGTSVQSDFTSRMPRIELQRSTAFVVFRLLDGYNPFFCVSARFQQMASEDSGQHSAGEGRSDQPTGLT
jgi:hypothetical protein